MKFCTKCKETKPKSEFFKNKTRSDGFQTSCKVCASKVNKEYHRFKDVSAD